MEYRWPFPGDGALPQSAGELGLTFSSYGRSASAQGPLAPYIVELRMHQPASLDCDAVAEWASRRSGFHIQARSDSPNEAMFAFPELVASLRDGAMPYQITLLEPDPGDMRRHPSDATEPSVRQTWDWPGLRRVLGDAPASLFATDLFGGAISVEDRFNAYHAILSVAVEQLGPAAINWLPAQRMVKPEEYLAATGAMSAAAGSARLRNRARAAGRHVPVRDGASSSGHGGLVAVFDIMVNVRLVRVEGSSPQSFLMDTFGMSHLGLPDVQLHFTDLEPDGAAAFLKNVACYLFENGDVIADGHTVEGMTGQPWPCRHEIALIAPRRVVLDVDPWPHGPRRT